MRTLLARLLPLNWRDRSLLIRALVLAAPLLLFAWYAVRFALHKSFSIDEFQYAHASWLIARGQVPYRDFFEVHLPLTYQTLSLLWLDGSDDPRNIVRLRVAMLLMLTLACLAVWRLCAARGGRLLGLIAPLLLLSCLPFLSFATEIRNDPTAFAFYASALAALTFETVKPRARAVVSGACLALACWGTQKAFWYGSPFAAALLADFFVHRRRNQGYLLADPVYFLIGAGAVALPIAGYLLLTGSADDLYTWCFSWAARYQQRYSSFTWWNAFEDYLWDHWWHLPLVAIGLVSTVRRLAREPGEPHVDQLLVASLGTGLMSATLQITPWPYSLLPFIGFSVIFAARGLIELIVRAREKASETRISGAFVAFTAAIAVGFILARAREKFEARLNQRSNEYQMKVLGDVERLTNSSDAAYDNSGSYVSRPHAYFYFYTDAATREHEKAMLTREVPLALERTEAVMVFRDERMGGLPRPLLDHIGNLYQRYSGDIWLWGMHSKGRRGFDFRAVKDGKYFIEPASALARGTMTVDGAPLSGPVFELTKGPHRIESSADTNFYVLWLPRDGKRWAPNPNAPHRFSTIL